MGLHINNDKLTPALCIKLAESCPFGAINTSGNDEITIGPECRLCKACIKIGEGSITYEEEKRNNDNYNWNGIAVFCEISKKDIHEISFELLGKASELAIVANQPVYALVIGSGIKNLVPILSTYGADEIYVYDHHLLENYLVEPYTNIVEDFISRTKPSTMLIGATSAGRSLAPRIAARLKTGLTADCTALEMDESNNLIQIRPAFGGNIMARIITPNSRPQFCTVRYKIFSKIHPRTDSVMQIHNIEVTDKMLSCSAEILTVERKPEVSDISEADIVVQIGRGVKSQKDLDMVQELAAAIGGQIACTRPLVEKHWFDSRKQIGLSGRTVKPKLLICIGVSGAVQTVAGMKRSEYIIAINNNPNAPIFDVANFGLVGDLYQIIPLLLNKIKGSYNNVQ